MNKILFSMVSPVYKWLMVSVAGCFFFTQPINSEDYSGFPGSHHPLHVSTTEINHNASEKTLEISCRIFTDDFESCLSKQFNTKADLSAANMKTAMDTLVKKYITSHIQIKTDDRPASLQYLGFEKEEQAIYAYFQADNVPMVKKVDIDDSILHDLYEDQISIIHVIVGGNRKSVKLDYPNKSANFSF